MINKICLCKQSAFKLYKRINSNIQSIPEGLDRKKNRSPEDQKARDNNVGGEILCEVF